MKRLYLVTDIDYEYCIGIVESSVKEARKRGLNHFPESEFIDIRVKWKKDIDISKYPIGYTFDDTGNRLMEGLKIGVYDNLEEGECLNCHYKGYVEHIDKNPFVLCSRCQDEMDNKRAIL